MALSGFNGTFDVASTGAPYGHPATLTGAVANAARWNTPGFLTHQRRRDSSPATGSGIRAARFYKS